MVKSLELLRGKYNRPNESVNSVDNIKQRYLSESHHSILDLLLIVGELTSSINKDISSLDPLAVKAITETSPNFKFDSFSMYSDEQILGVLNTAKGKYFEYLVVERLNTGNSVGNLVLPEGYTAEMAASLTQPGWDIVILNSNGIADQYLQLKATNSISYIKDTLDRYPEFSIVATEEVANLSSGLVIDSGVSEESLNNQLSEIIDNHSFTSEELLSIFIPILPISWICLSEGYALYLEKSSVGDALSNTKIRAKNAVMSTAVGGLATVLGAGLFAIPLTMLSHSIIEQYDYEQDLSNDINLANQRLYKLVSYQSNY